MSERDELAAWCACGHTRGLHSDWGRWCSGPDRSDKWGVCRCGGFAAAALRAAALRTTPDATEEEKP
jgi:hypothetical protein